MVGGAEPSLSKLGNATRDSLMGYHRAFNEQQIPVDFVHTSDVIQNKLGAYKILFLPFPVMLSREAAQGVARYIEDKRSRSQARVSPKRPLAELELSSRAVAALEKAGITEVGQFLDKLNQGEEAVLIR